MREEKRNRIIAAIVVNAILFVFILLGVVIAQWVTIGVLGNRKKVLKAQLEADLKALGMAENVLDDFECRGKLYETCKMWVDTGTFTPEEIIAMIKKEYPDIDLDETSFPVLAVVVE